MWLVEFQLDAGQVVLHLLQPPCPDHENDGHGAPPQPRQSDLGGRTAAALAGHRLNRLGDGVRATTGSKELRHLRGVETRWARFALLPEDTVRLPLQSGSIALVLPHCVLRWFNASHYFIPKCFLMKSITSVAHSSLDCWMPACNWHSMPRASIFSFNTFPNFG
jgi:hypothetical protein